MGNDEGFWLSLLRDRILLYSVLSGIETHRNVINKEEKESLDRLSPTLCESSHQESSVRQYNREARIQS